MAKSIVGKKIGMTQIFSDKDKVVPVTAIDYSNWFVTGIKSVDRDGYDAIQVGSLRKKYTGKEFSDSWLKNINTYFSDVKEVDKSDFAQEISLGQAVDFSSVFNVGEEVDVFGTTKGYGFQGVVKRHGFTGGRASHGPRFGRIPGSIGFMRSKGRVIKGKKLPGHLGNVQRVMKNLEIIKVEPEAKVLFVKGSVPGGAGSLVFMRKV